MKKEDVYKLIEYSGVYDDKVKKNLKNIIKKYHPDKNKKDKKTIQVIYEVKKELENDKISYKPKKEIKNKKNDFITEEECVNNIIKLSKVSNKNDEKLRQMYDGLSKLFDEYGSLFRKLNEKKDYLCELNDNSNDLRKIEILLKYIALITFIVFIVILLFYDKELLIVLIILLVFIIFIAYIFNKKIENANRLIKKSNNDMKKIQMDITLLQDKIRKYSNDIHALERKNTNVKNDIRFYKNMKNN